ncbi:MAG: DUF4296 domain-containing protein [Marinilabiliaceae bacterium]|nr:DUF4296 domain-containing protein [Marinilabiliaceae bacterium]
MNKRNIIIVVAIILSVVGGWYLHIFIRDSWIPSQNKFAHIVADVYLADAVAQVRGDISNKYKDKTMESIYRSVLNRYGLTKAQYDSIVRIYSDDPTKNALLYADIVDILTKREADYEQLYNMQDSIDKHIAHLQDSLKTVFWKKIFLIRYPLEEKDTIARNLTFLYNADSLRGGTLQFAMDYNFTQHNSNKNDTKMSLITFYTDNIADTSWVTIDKSSYSIRNIRIDHAIRDSIPATKIKLCLMDTKDLKDAKVVMNNIKLEYSPYNITDSIKFDEIQFPPIFAY